MSGPAGPGAGFVQTCHLRGLPGPGPRVTFWPARKSPKSRQRRRRSDSPPPLESLSPPAKAGGLRAPALDPAPKGAGRRPGGRPPQSRLRRASSPGSAGGAKGKVRTRPAAAEREGRGIQVCTKLLPCLPPCTRSSCRSKGPSWSVPKASSSPPPRGAPLLLRGEEEEGAEIWTRPQTCALGANEK